MPTPLPLELLASLAADGASPRLTWYGPDGERTELSGRVLGNWVTKVANLLLEEADAEPGTRVLIDLPVHWRAVVWSLGAWTAGAEVVLPPKGAHDDSAAAGDVVVTSRPGRAPSGQQAELVLAVALPALAMRWDGEALPPGVVDAAAELMTYADQLGFTQSPDDGDVALRGPETVTYGELGQWAAAPAGLLGAAAGDRLLLTPATPAELLGQAIGVWRAGGSVVLAEPGATEQDLARIAAEERAERR